MSAPEIGDEVISLLKQISGRKTIARDQCVGRDVGIFGGDGIVVVDALESRFGIDLDPLIESATIRLPPRWIDRLRGRDHGPADADVTVGELIDYIAAAVAAR